VDTDLYRIPWVVNIRETLARLLKKRGYELRKKSNTGKIVEKFEKEEISKKLFNLMKSDQVFRVIGYYLFKKSIMNVNDLVREISKSNLGYTMSESIVKKAICKHCKNEILFPKFDPKPNISCQKCGRKDFSIENDWELKRDIYGVLIHYLNKLVTNGILSRNLETHCPACLTGSEYFDEDEIKKGTKNVQELFCKKCGRFNEIKWIYTPPETISDLWESNGAWLEWYVKNLLSHKNIDVVQGVTIKSNKQEIEVDCILVKSNKIISIECRSKSFNRTYGEELDISKLSPFSDYVVFVTTTKFGDNLKSRYAKIAKRCKKLFIDGNEIERLPEIISKIR